MYDLFRGCNTSVEALYTTSGRCDVSPRPVSSFKMRSSVFIFLLPISWGDAKDISALDTTVLHCRPRVKRLTYSYSNCGYDRKCLSLYVSRMEGGPKTLLWSERERGKFSLLLNALQAAGKRRRWAWRNRTGNGLGWHFLKKKKILKLGLT